MVSGSNLDESSQAVAWVWIQLSFVPEPVPEPERAPRARRTTLTSGGSRHVSNRLADHRRPLPSTFRHVYGRGVVSIAGSTSF
jgi:hypothetical protein